MLFSSPFFIFGFLPLFLLIYFSCKSLNLRNFVIILFSSIFFIWGDLQFFIVVFVGTLIDFTIIKYLLNNKERQLLIAKQHILAFSIFINLSLLLFFKYGNFFVDQIESFLILNHLEKPSWYGVALPLGISFVTFHRISLLVDSYSNPSAAPKTFSHALMYVIVFPHMIAGPIVQYAEIRNFIINRPLVTKLFVHGFFVFSLGLAKKVLIADPLGSVADVGFDGNIGDLSTLYVWFTLIAYSLQIYFDFSGYSDMAVGLARMIGIRFPANFKMPYTATSITDFWKRWHITLSKWMRRYLYVPLGGNRCGFSRTIFNLWLVFFLSGLWHGASWNFVFWGLFHGTFISLEKALSHFNVKLNAHWAIKQVITYFIVLNSWVLFRSDEWDQASDIFTKMYFRFDSFALHPFFFFFTTHQVFTIIVASILAFFPFWRYVDYRRYVRRLLRTKPVTLLVSFLLILVCSSFMFANKTTSFLYFRF